MPQAEINVSMESFEVHYTDNEQVLKFHWNPGSECETNLMICLDLVIFQSVIVCLVTIILCAVELQAGQNENNIFFLNLHFTSPDGPV